MTATKTPAAPKVKKSGINITQYKILKAINGAKGPINRADLKEGVGIGRDGKYSHVWLNFLNALRDSKLIKIEVTEEQRGFVHSITKSGVVAMRSFEKTVDA